MLRIIKSWLEPRSANVVVGGRKSAEFQLKDMLFQGTVLGPILWALFFADARKAWWAVGYDLVVFADNLTLIGRCCQNSNFFAGS